MSPTLLQSLSPEMEQCAIDCVNCYSVCLRTIQYCLRKKGTYAEADSINELMNCVEICQTTENFILGSNSDISSRVCELCAEICDRCAISCEKFGDDAQMQACAEISRRCANSCRMMSPSSLAA
jgi:hypothetical protein